MALVQVPYNNAMRLGQGFNTYTQEICIDNAVVGMSNPEDSQPIVPIPTVPVIVGGQPVKEPEQAGTLVTVTKESLATVIGQSTPQTDVVTTQYPSQIVTYYSKYVDKLSDVSNNLNVSATLAIKYGEISGGGSGSFVDVETFQNSDMNFIVSVKVINQTINIKDQLQFWPLTVDNSPNASPPGTRNPTAAEFTATYGDSFISGFQEGGQFFAIVSIKALDSSQKNEIKVAAQLALNVGAGEVSADGSVELAKQTLQKNSEINITVNWSGGGQLKEGSDKWDIDTLTEVAVRFPDLVAQCPQRTHAILTKYTALRGYLEWKASKASTQLPFDYDIASLYTSDLLDIYMGYKVIWDAIHTMLDAFSSGTPILVKAAEPIPPIYAPASSVNPSDNPFWGSQLHPFENDIFGLDKAVQQCRLLMIRLVQEVTILTADPSQAILASRPVAYLRAQLFRQLLPTMSVQSVLPSVYGMPPLLFPAMDAFGPSGTTGAITNAPNTFTGLPTSVPVYFPPSDSAPSITVGLTRIDMYRGPRPGGAFGNFRLNCNIDVSNLRFSEALVTASLAPKSIGTAFDGLVKGASATYALGVQPLVVSSDSSTIQTGYFDSGWSTVPSDPIGDKWSDYSNSWPVTFSKPFAAPPNVVLFLAGFDRPDSTDNVSVAVFATKVTTAGFRINVSSRVGLIYQVSVSWIAIPTNAIGLACGNTKNPSTVNPAKWSTISTGRQSFGAGIFSSPPTVYLALSGFSFGPNIQLRVQTAQANVTAQGFDWSAAPWGDGLTQFVDASVGWLAVAS